MDSPITYNRVGGVYDVKKDASKVKQWVDLINDQKAITD
jgi:hypothetical protein